MSSRVLRPPALLNSQSHRPQRQYDAGDVHAVHPGRLLVMLLVLLCFVRAVVIPPCDMHHVSSTLMMESGSEGMMASAHHHSSTAPASEDSGEHSGPCTCLGDCHPAAATPLASESPALVLAATVTIATAHRPTTLASILPVAQAHVLPFATAPPTHEV